MNTSHGKILPWKSLLSIFFLHYEHTGLGLLARELLWTRVSLSIHERCLESPLIIPSCSVNHSGCCRWSAEVPWSQKLRRSGSSCGNAQLYSRKANSGINRTSQWFFRASKYVWFLIGPVISGHSSFMDSPRWGRRSFGREATGGLSLSETLVWWLE